MPNLPNFGFGAPLAVSGTSAGNVYVAASNYSKLHHWDGGVWTDITLPASNRNVESIWVSPSGSVYAGGDGYLYSCSSACTVASNYTGESKLTTVKQVCGSDDSNVYAVAQKMGQGTLYKFSPGSGWVEVLTEGRPYQSCWVSPSGEVVIGASSAIYRYPSSDGGISEDLIAWPNGTRDFLQDFNAVWGFAGTLLAVGNKHTILTHDAGAWVFLRPPNGVDAYNAISGVTNAEVYIAGYGGNGNIVRYPGLTSPSQAPPIDIYGVWAASANEYFAVGVGVPSGNGTVFRGTR